MFRRLVSVVVLVVLVLAACSGDDDGSSTSNPTPSPAPAETSSATPPDTIEVEPTEQPVATPSPTPVPEPGVLLVNDADVVGSPGDDLLSLAEAVRVANGSVPVADLSPGEAAQVTGDPGREVADTITVEVPELGAPGGDFWLVEMFGNDGDTVDGAKSTVVPSAADDDARNLFFVASSDVTVRGFSFEGMHVAVAVESVGETVQGITVEDNTFAETRLEDIAVRNTLTGGSISGVSIVGNSFTNNTGGFTVHRFISVFGALPTDTEVTDTALTDIAITGNTMTSAEGVTATCIAVHGGALMLSSTAGTVGAGVDGVTIADNDLRGCPVGIELNGGASLQQSGTVEGASLTGVSISNSTLAGVDTAIAVRGGASTLVADFEVGPDAAMILTSSIVDVAITDVTIEGFAVGIDLVGGLSDFETDTVSGNSLSGVTIESLSFVDVAAPCTVRVDAGQGAIGNTVDATCDGALVAAGG